jgi:hypothetical protein
MNLFKMKFHITMKTMLVKDKKNSSLILLGLGLSQAPLQRPHVHKDMVLLSSSQNQIFITPFDSIHKKLTSFILFFHTKYGFDSIYKSLTPPFIF